MLKLHEMQNKPKEPIEKIREYIEYLDNFNEDEVSEALLDLDGPHPDGRIT
jgi:hypothetical protein